MTRSVILFLFLGGCGTHEEFHFAQQKLDTTWIELVPDAYPVLALVDLLGTRTGLCYVVDSNLLRGNETISVDARMTARELLDRICVVLGAQWRAESRHCVAVIRK